MSYGVRTVSFWPSLIVFPPNIPHRYYVSKYETSTAFLATESFEDKNSLSARMLQARYSNFGRFSCMAMVDFISVQENAAGGMDGLESARRLNPEGYVSPFDRNWVLIFASIFTQSLSKETGVNGLEVNALQWWREQCEEPASFRAPTPEAVWRADPLRVGETDAFGNTVEVRDFAPLVTFGSLRQLRAPGGAAAEAWPEDATTSLLRVEIEAVAAREAKAAELASIYGGRRLRDAERLNESHWAPWTDDGVHYADASTTIATTERPRPGGRGRKLFTNAMIARLITKALGAGYQTIDKELNFNVPEMPRPHFFYDHTARQSNFVSDQLRDVFCNPDYSLTIEQVVGDPPPHVDSLWDAISVNRPKSMETPASLRGGDVHGGYTNNGPAGSKPSYSDTSLMSWVYVTSSDDDKVTPGFHRLADLRVWPDTKCDAIKRQPCGSLAQGGSGSSSSWLALSWFKKLLIGRRLASWLPLTYIFVNEGDDFVEPPVSNHLTGKEALLGARCSTLLSQNGVDGARACTGSAKAWFRSHGSSGCATGRLELDGVSELRPVDQYRARHSNTRPHSFRYTLTVCFRDSQCRDSRLRLLHRGRLPTHLPRIRPRRHHRRPRRRHHAWRRSPRPSTSPPESSRTSVTVCTSCPPKRAATPWRKSCTCNSNLGSDGANPSLKHTHTHTHTLTPFTCASHTGRHPHSRRSHRSETRRRHHRRRRCRGCLSKKPSCSRSCPFTRPDSAPTLCQPP